MHTLRLLLSAPLLSVALIACKAPPEAPQDLEELCGYLYDHSWDEDTLELEAGVVNLTTWLSLSGNLESTLEGYQITSLDQQVVDDLVEYGFELSPDVSELVGASVANASAFKPGDLADALVVDDQDVVFPKNYNWYERDFPKDPECFPGRDCMSLQADAESESSWVGIITVGTKNRIQYRWVDVPDVGWVFMHRSWLKEPAEISLDGVEVNSQYFLGVTVPHEGGALRLQATWIDAEYGALPVGEDFAKQQVVKSMQKQGEELEEYMASK